LQQLGPSVRAQIVGIHDVSVREPRFFADSHIRIRFRYNQVSAGLSTPLQDEGN
jgi:hypothetical protein